MSGVEGARALNGRRDNTLPSFSGGRLAPSERVWRGAGDILATLKFSAWRSAN